MRVLITGGAGFIGANLARRLSRSAAVDELVVLDDLSTGSQSNLAGVDLELLKGSILDRELLRRAVAGADVVVHLAANASVTASVEDPLSTHAVNVTGTLNVLEEVRRTGSAQLIFASSSAVYGEDPTEHKHEGLRPQPISPYAVSKLAAESYVSAYVRVYGITALTFRFFNVFGPLQPSDHPYAAAVPAFVSKALTGEPLTVFGDGEQTRDFVYVGEVAAVIEQAIHARTSSAEPVNLAGGRAITVNGLITAIETALGHPVDVVRLPRRPGDILHSVADVSRLRGFFPTYDATPLTEGLDATIEWFGGQVPRRPHSPRFADRHQQVIRQASRA